MSSPDAATASTERVSTEDVLRRFEEEKQRDAAVAAQGSTLSTEPVATEEALRRLAQEDDAGDAEQAYAPVKTGPADLAADDVEQLAARFTQAASLSGGARLILAWPGREPPSRGRSLIQLETTVAGWVMLGVFQGLHDVWFDINISFDAFVLKCTIYYVPTANHCVLVNQSRIALALTPLEQSSSPVAAHTIPVSPERGTATIGTGLWDVSGRLRSDAPADSLARIFILCRQFSVSIHDAENASVRADTGKRQLSEADGVVVPVQAQGVALKRRKQDGTGSVFEALVIPGSVASSTHTNTIAAGEERGLDLKDGEMAVVCTKGAAAKTLEEAEAAYGPPAQQPSYKLVRLGNVGSTRASTVFASRHSGLEGQDVVAKVLSCKVQDAQHIMRCAKTWSQEKTFLEKLAHPNIMSLKAFDGRVFALYLESLPQTLDRALDSPFRASDNAPILRDAASALAYLARVGVAHNDIKPSNIAYSPDRGAVLLDFGLASRAQGQDAQVVVVRGGTPWYIPPEQMVGNTSRGAPGDVWAMGVSMLYVLGAIWLPEKAHHHAIYRGWNVFAVERPGPPRTTMENWLGFVEEKRNRLDRQDCLQGAVYRMLDVDRGKRLTAAAVLAALDVAGLGRRGKMDAVQGGKDLD